MSKGPTNEKLEQWKEAWKTRADQLVLNVFPQKVFEYDELLKSEMFQLSHISEIKSDTNIPVPSVIPSDSTVNNANYNSRKRKVDSEDAENFLNDVSSTKVLAFVNGVSPSNKKMLDLIDIVKPIVREIVENVNKEETLSEVRAVESEAAAFLDQISRYFFTRGKLVSRIAKYPHVEDYRQAIVDLDEKEFLNLRLVLTEVRNHYTVIHDMIVKNYEKIKKPRSCNTEHLY